DILIFTTKPQIEAEASVRYLVKEHNFKINEPKFKAFRVACMCETNCPHGHACPCKKKCTCAKNSMSRYLDVDFLGYKIIFPAHNESRGNFNNVSCSFSTKKVSKIKQKIWLSIHEFTVNYDVELLI